MTELIFSHGWAFDHTVWDGMRAVLPGYGMQVIDQGYFGAPARVTFEAGKKYVLIGHSLGFPQGLKLKQDWAATVAINSFARFVGDKTAGACVGDSELGMIQQGMNFMPKMALGRFYDWIGGQAPSGPRDDDRLIAGLDELETVNLAAQSSVPSLVLASRNDPLVPVQASEKLAQVLSAETVWHATAGHMLPQNDAAFRAEQIKAFLVKSGL